MKIIVKLMAWLVIVTSLLFFILAVTKTQTVYARKVVSIRSFLYLDHIDVVVFTYWPDGELLEKNVTREITNLTQIKELLRELDKIPAKGSGRHVKLDSRASEYKIEFFNKSKLLGILRIKADMLDSPFEKGWDFYDEGIDQNFVSLVKNMTK